MAESQPPEGRVKINVGGTMFETSLSTLKKFENSMLASLVADRWQGQDELLFIDRNPTYFANILDYLRDGEYVALPDDDNSLKCLRREAEFYNLPSLVEICSAKLQHAANRNEPQQCSRRTRRQHFFFVKPATFATDASRGSEHERNRPEKAEEKEHESDRIKINVGGTVFETLRSTLSGGFYYKSEVLAAMAANLDKNEFFIDRDPTYFQEILNVLRDPSSLRIFGDDNVRESIVKEAKFYKLRRLELVCSLKDFKIGDEVYWSKNAVDSFWDFLIRRGTIPTRRTCADCGNPIMKVASTLLSHEDESFFDEYIRLVHLRDRMESMIGNIASHERNCLQVRWYTSFSDETYLFTIDLPRGEAGRLLNKFVILAQ